MARRKKKSQRSSSPLQKVLLVVASKLRPTQKSEPAITKFIATLQKNIPQAMMQPGGSYAKGTSIRGTHDVDVFVCFPKGTQNTDMYEAIEKALPNATRLHGSRDYYQVKRKKYLFEIVPVIASKTWEHIENTTDMSPLHVHHVATKLNEKQKDDVRLAKQFTKAAGVYGAESFRRGFSGYVLELLIEHYKSFEKLLRAAQRWKAPVVIDPAKHYQSAGEALRRLNEAKTQSPIILVDPLQPERNAAAALSEQSFEQLKRAAKAFLANPNPTFFDTAIKKSVIKKSWRGKKILFITVNTPKGKQDIVGCKVRDAFERGRDVLKKNDFPVVHSEWRFEEKKSTAWYVLAKTKMPKTRVHAGPPSHLEAHVDAFCAEHAHTFKKGSRWYATVQREHTEAKKALQAAWRPLKTKIS